MSLVNACPIPVLCRFNPSTHRELLSVVVAGSIRIGCQVKVYDGLGGRLALIAQGTAQAPDEELGEGDGIWVCPLRPDAQGFLWWELDGQQRKIRLPPGTNAAVLRRNERILEFTCFRVSVQSPSEENESAVELQPHQALSIFELPTSPSRLSIALLAADGSTSEWSMPMRLPLLPDCQTSSSAGLKVQDTHLAAEELLELHWGCAIFPVLARRSAMPNNEVFLCARRWFVNSTSLPVQLLLPDGSPMPQLASSPAGCASILAYGSPVTVQRQEEGEQAGCQRLRNCFQTPPEPDLGSSIFLGAGDGSCQAVEIPDVGGFEDVRFPGGRDCVLRAESLSRAATFGADCSLLTLSPGLFVFNCSKDTVGFHWASQASHLAVWLAPGERRALWHQDDITGGDSARGSTPLLASHTRDGSEGEVCLQVAVRGANGRVVSSPAFGAGRQSTGCASPLALTNPDPGKSPCLMCIAVDEDFGAVAISVAGPERCHRLECRHPHLEAFIEVPGPEAYSTAVAKYGAAAPVFFGLTQPFAEHPVSPSLVLRHVGQRSSHNARVQLDLSRSSSQKLPPAVGLGMPARIEVSVKGRVALVTVSLGWRIAPNETHESPGVEGSDAPRQLELSYELHLGGIAVALVADPLQTDAHTRRPTAEVFSISLDAVRVQLQRFSDDSEEACLRIGATQVDLRPQQARQTEPLVLLSSSGSWGTGGPPFLRWTSLRLSRSNSTLTHLQCGRVELGPSEVMITEAVWQELGSFLDTAVPGARGLCLEDVERRIRKELPLEPPEPGLRIHLERFSVEALFLKVWCSLYLPEATFLPGVLRAAIELTGLGTETLVVDGAKVRVPAQPWLVGRGKPLLGTASSVLDSLSRAYLPHVRGSLFSLVANSNVAFGGLLGRQWWGQICGCERRQTVTVLRPPICLVGTDGVVHSSDGQERGADFDEMQGGGAGWWRWPGRRALILVRHFYASLAARIRQSCRLMGRGHEREHEGGPLRS
eukprot:TRINITY_DN50368_c0_g1_i1.p1 TRINITY_DN50368_c0_g1~~TRINITY_DN50368_c0_g1_i1.p1  ORF type:complete len:993 (-),score=164.34 TRINITY_DN50368_c0_g1_i1:239-3217(-)